jgi:hypothetical protein
MASALRPRRGSVIIVTGSTEGGHARALPCALDRFGEAIEHRLAVERLDLLLIRPREAVLRPGCQCWDCFCLECFSVFHSGVPPSALLLERVRYHN